MNTNEYPEREPGVFSDMWQFIKRDFTPRTRYRKRTIINTWLFVLTLAWVGLGSITLVILSFVFPTPWAVSWWGSWFLVMIFMIRFGNYYSRKHKETRFW